MRDLGTKVKGLAYNLYFWKKSFEFSNEYFQYVIAQNYSPPSFFVVLLNFFRGGGGIGAISNVAH